MTLIEAVKNNFSRKHYANWNGRASRSEYWYFVLFGTVINILISVLAKHLAPHMATKPNNPLLLAVATIMLALAIPGIAVLGRRLHDSDRSAWQQCWQFPPLVLMYLPIGSYARIGTLGYLAVLIFQGTRASTPGQNRFDWPAMKPTPQADVEAYTSDWGRTV